MNLKLSLSDDDETRKLWNFKFELNYEICLKKNSLETAFKVINKGKRCDLNFNTNFSYSSYISDELQFDFTCLLHTYFKTSSINDVIVNGLENLTYIDKVEFKKAIK